MNIQDRVTKVVSEQLGDHLEIQPQTHLIEDLGADSLDIVELGMALEDEFQTEVRDEDIVRWQTVQDLINQFEGS